MRSVDHLNDSYHPSEWSPIAGFLVTCTSVCIIYTYQYIFSILIYSFHSYMVSCLFFQIL